MSANDEPKKAFIKGALWTIGGRWLIRILGLVNTIVLARVLMPSDYGVVAMAMLLVGLIQAISDVGVTTALLRKKDIDVPETDSAWTLRCIQGLVIACVLLAITPFASRYFEEERLHLILPILAFCLVLEGFGSLGPVLAQRQLNFVLEFRLQLIAKVASIGVAWIAAIVMADYRALVIGIVTTYILRFTLGYAMHPYRPRWVTSEIAGIWKLTRWLMLSSMALFLLRRSDELIAAKVGTTSSFGMYHVGSDLGRAPVEEVGPPLMRAFLPVLAGFQSDHNRVNQAVIKTLAATSTLTMPVAVGMWSVSQLFVEVVMGAKWLDAAPFLGMYALVSVVQFTANPISSLLVLHGHTKTQSNAAWLELSVFVIATLMLLPMMQLLGLVWARLIASAFSLWITIFYSRKMAGLSVYSVVNAVWRQATGALMMAIVLGFAAQIDLKPLWLNLMANIGLGAIVYTIWSLATWKLFGKPEGLESTIVDYLQERRRKT